MAELLTDDEFDLDEDGRERRKGESVGTPLPEENMRLIRMAGGMSGVGPRAEVPTASSKLPDTLTPAQPESIGTPIQGMQPANVPRPAYERYQSLSAEKQKPWSDLGVGGKVGRVAESIGTAINPNIVAAIPGTAAHHQREVGQARTAAQQENAEITGQSEEELREAQAEEQRALAKKNANPTAKHIPTVIQGPNGEPMAAGYDPATNQYINPDTQQPIPGAKKWEKPAMPPHGNDFDSYYAKWLKDNNLPDTAANQLKAHKEWETQGGKEPQGTWMPLYDDKGRVVGAWNAATGQHRTSAPEALPGHTAPGAHIASTAEAATEKKTAPLQAVIDEADKAQALKDMADKGNAEADVDLALTFFKTMRSATQGGSGIRFTQQENNLIMGARSLWGSLEVRGNKIFSNGEPLSKEQRQQILDVINVHKQGAQRQLDRMKQGSEAAPAAGGAAQPTGGGFKPF